MKINIPFNQNLLPKRFGKEADCTDIIKGNPIRSFPFEISELPEGTKYIAITLIDYDAIPVCSFPWIHWLATDIEVKNNTVIIPENYSLDYKDSITQGKIVSQVLYWKLTFLRLILCLLDQLLLIKIIDIG